MARKKVETAAQVTKKDYETLRRPIVTEKSSHVGGSSASACVVFEVDKKANKADIREAVERVFGVSVQAVRTCSYLGKLKRTTGAHGRRASFKKAYVTLKQGEKIDVIEGL
jgi:large subunit ribosomal protein L23